GRARDPGAAGGDAGTRLAVVQAQPGGGLPAGDRGDGAAAGHGGFDGLWGVCEQPGAVGSNQRTERREGAGVGESGEGGQDQGPGRNGRTKGPERAAVVRRTIDARG